MYEFSETEMSHGDYLDYIKALETIEACKRLARINPTRAKQLRHVARESLLTLELRYNG